MTVPPRAQIAQLIMSELASLSSQAPEPTYLSSTIAKLFKALIICEGRFIATIANNDDFLSIEPMLQATRTEILESVYQPQNFPWTDITQPFIADKLRFIGAINEVFGQNQQEVGVVLLRAVRREMESKGIPGSFNLLSGLLVDYVTANVNNNEFMGKLIRDQPWKESCRAAILGLFVQDLDFYNTNKEGRRVLEQLKKSQNNSADHANLVQSVDILKKLRDAFETANGCNIVFKGAQGQTQYCKLVLFNRKFTYRLIEHWMGECMKKTVEFLFSQYRLLEAEQSLAQPTLQEDKDEDQEVEYYEEELVDELGDQNQVEQMVIEEQPNPDIEDMQNQVNLDYPLDLEGKRIDIRAKRSKKFSDKNPVVARKLQFTDRVVEFVEPDSTETVQIDTTSRKALLEEVKQTVDQENQVGTGTKRVHWIPESDSMPFEETRRRFEQAKKNEGIAATRAKQQIEFRVPISNFLLNMGRGQKK